MEDFMIFGLILQFIVGAVQLLIALIQTLSRFSNERPLGNLKIYWLLVAIYSVVLFLLYLLMLSNRSFEELCLTWFLSAWGIAVYYIVKGRK